MKSIYEFTVNKIVKKQIEEQTDQGKLLKDVEQKVPVKVIFKRPSRAESEEADIVSAVEYSESIRKGILTKALLERFYDEKGGFLAENYEARYGQLLTRFYTFQNEYTRLTTLKDNKKPEDQKRLNELIIGFGKVKSELEALESSRQSLFQNTAETRAQNKTILWLILFLTYIQEDEAKGPMPFFEGKTFEEKRDDYDKKADEEDDFFFQVIGKLSFFTSLWILGKASNQEDFKRIEDTLNPPQVQEEVEPDKQEDEPIEQTEESLS